MTLRDSHPVGTPSWVDLTTTDVDGAIDFYGAVFGWEFERDPTGEITYVMAMTDGHPAAGVMALPDEMISQGVPPCWNVHVTVDDAEATAGQITAAGGTVIVPPVDVPDGAPEPAGRMVVGADPTGAVICAWKPLSAVGAGIVNAPGAFTWAEVATNDDAAAAAFYSEVFGWEAGPMEEAPEELILFTLNGAPVASTATDPLNGVPPHWRVTLGAADVDAACATVKANGGTVLAEPFDWGPGRMATIADPAGAIVGLATLTDWPA